MHEDFEIRVLVVDDSAFLRRTLPQMLESDPCIRVIGTAANGEEAIEMAKKLRPDVITLDVMMPVMDGISALRRIMREIPTPVLMVSSTTDEGSRQTMDALSLGAVDYLPKPSGPTSLDIAAIRDAFINKIKIVASARITVPGAKPPTAAPVQKAPPPPVSASHGQSVKRRLQLVAIAASTGGPAALQVLLSEIPERFPAGIVIVQHIAGGFSQALADRLDAISHLEIKLCADFERVRPGSALLAPAGRHLRIKYVEGRIYAELASEPSDILYRPSADILFSSIAQKCAPVTCAVIMTGMGKDGAMGIKAIRKRGGITMAQDEASCAIFGMPKDAIESGGIDRVVPLKNLAKELCGMAGV